MSFWRGAFRIEKEGVLPDVDPPAPATAGGKQLKEVGWAKGIELAKLARRDRQHFDCATWLHKTRQMPKEDFKKDVEKELTRRETEPWERSYRPCLPANSLIRSSKGRTGRRVQIDQIDHDLIRGHTTSQTIFIDLGRNDYDSTTPDDFFELRR
jgi:hypothetical protein